MILPLEPLTSPIDARAHKIQRTDDISRLLALSTYPTPATEPRSLRVHVSSRPRTATVRTPGRAAPRVDAEPHLVEVTRTRFCALGTPHGTARPFAQRGMARVWRPFDFFEITSAAVAAWAVYD